MRGSEEGLKRVIWRHIILYLAKLYIMHISVCDMHMHIYFSMKLCHLR